MKTFYVLIFAFLFVNINVIAQNTIVTGRIIDTNGLPIIGAKITVNRPATETTTDFDGKFSLEIEYETILYINFVGFKQMEVLVKPNTNIIFLLQDDSNQVATNLSRKEMRKLNRDNNKQPPGDGSNLVETLFYTLKAISK